MTPKTVDLPRGVLSNCGNHPPAPNFWDPSSPGTTTGVPGIPTTPLCLQVRQLVV